MAVWPLVTITSSFRGERVRAESTIGASPGRVSAHVSYSLLMTSTGTTIAPGSASKIVPSEEPVRRVAGEVRTAPETFEPRWAPDGSLPGFGRHTHEVLTGSLFDVRGFQKLKELF